MLSYVIYNPKMQTHILYLFILFCVKKERKLFLLLIEAIAACFTLCILLILALWFMTCLPAVLTPALKNKQLHEKSMSVENHTKYNNLQGFNKYRKENSPRLIFFPL